LAEPGLATSHQSLSRTANRFGIATSRQSIASMPPHVGAIGPALHPVRRALPALRHGGRRAVARRGASKRPWYPLRHCPTLGCRAAITSLFCLYRLSAKCRVLRSRAIPVSSIWSAPNHTRDRGGFSSLQLSSRDLDLFAGIARPSCHCCASWPFPILMHHALPGEESWRN
jgi:hypothetical protein